ncbi:type 1 glutamine amidotransferase [Bacillus cereus]|nr:type 1 glutamine amidotransferase [Bacillus cereus]
MSKKIAILITDYFEDTEYTEPVKSCNQKGYELTTIEMEKGKRVNGKQGKSEVVMDKGIDGVSPENFDALFIPGGFSLDILRADERFFRFSKTFMAAKKPVFAICHAPQLLIIAQTLEEHDVTGYKSIEVDLKNASGNFHDKEVVVCKNQLVTSRQPEDIPAFMGSPTPANIPLFSS